MKSVVARCSASKVRTATENGANALANAASLIAVRFTSANNPRAQEAIEEDEESPLGSEVASYQKWARCAIIPGDK
jgi:hypothetical protein